QCPPHSAAVLRRPADRFESPQPRFREAGRVVRGGRQAGGAPRGPADGLGGGPQPRPPGADRGAGGRDAERVGGGAAGPPRLAADPGAAGSVNVNVLPAFARLVTVRRPPWASTMCLAMARPSPVPPGPRDRERSTR